MEEKKKTTKKVTTKKKVSTKKTPVKTVAKKSVTPKVEVKTEKKIEPVRVNPKKQPINNLGLFVQAILTTYAVLLLAGGLFHEFFLNIFDAVVSLLLFVTAYNNNKVYKRKYLTVIYVIAGILFAGVFIGGLFN